MKKTIEVADYNWKGMKSFLIHTAKLAVQEGRPCIFDSTADTLEYLIGCGILDPFKDQVRASVFDNQPISWSEFEKQINEILKF